MTLRSEVGEAMRVAVLSRDNAPFGELIRTNAIVAGLRLQGHEVDLLIMDRYRALRAISPAFVPFCAAKLLLLLRKFGIPRSKSFLKPSLNGILNAFYLIPILRRGGYQILIAETHLSGLCAWLMHPQLEIRFYMDFHGTAEEVAAHAAFYEQAILLEATLVRECDFAISCSGMMRQHLIDKHGGDAQRHIVCHNGTEPRSHVAQHRLPLRVIFAGLFAYFQRVMDFVEAARLNTDPEIEFYLMGGGENEAEVLDYIKTHRIAITWLGYQPREATLAVFTTMQVGVSPATDDIARRVASPLKILDYAACGLPVVTVAVGEWCEIFRAYDAGVVCPTCDPETLLAAIRSLKDPDRWAKASRNAQRLVHEARTWPAVLAPLHEHLRALQFDENAAAGDDQACRLHHPARRSAV